MNRENPWEEAMKHTFGSRLLTMDALYKKFKANLDVLDPYSAIHFTTPLCDILLRAIDQLENYKSETEVSELINKCFKND